MMEQFICVYDFETDGTNPSKCSPVQLASCMIHNITLDIVEDSECCVYLKPEGFDDEDYYEKHKSTVDWHAKIKNTTPEEILEAWSKYPDQQQGWETFTRYLLKYNKNQSRKSKWTAPIRAGANIRKFDNIIVDRLASKYGNVDKNDEQKIFFPRDTIDITDIAFLWFESLPDPSSYSMDALRPFFGIPSEGSHDAIKDIRDCAWMIQKFMRLFRRQAQKIPFKGAYNRVAANQT